MSTVIDTTPEGVRLRVQYTPAPLVKAFIEDPVFIGGYFGPLGCGKTTAGAMKAWCYAQAYPGARIAVIRDTWPNLRDTTQKTFFEWFPDSVAGEYHHTSKTFWLHTNGAPAEILFRSMDDRKDISNVLSLDLAAAWIDEPQGGLALRGERLGHDPGIDHELFLSILARLGRQKGFPAMGWLTGNPPAPQHWIAKEFRYAGQGHPSNPRPDFHLYLGDQDTNRAHLRPGYYEHLEELFGVGTPMARRFLRGEWIEFAQVNPFQAAWIRYYDERPPLDGLYITLAIDPAISQRDEACRTALVVVGQGRTGAERMQIYTLKALAGRWSTYEQVEALLDLVQEFHPQRLRIEDVQWQRALKDIVEREAAVRGIRLPAVDLVRPDGDKLRRANQVAPFVESGWVLFGGPGARELVDALLAVPHDRSAWDLVDAFGLAVGGLPAQRPERSPLADPADTPARRIARSYAAVTVDPVLHRPSAYANAPRLPAGWVPGIAGLMRSGSSRGIAAERARRRAASYAAKPFGSPR